MTRFRDTRGKKMRTIFWHIFVLSKPLQLPYWTFVLLGVGWGGVGGVGPRISKNKVTENSRKLDCHAHGVSKAPQPLTPPYHTCDVHDYKTGRERYGRIRDNTWFSELGYNRAPLSAMLLYKGRLGQDRWIESSVAALANQNICSL